MDGNERRCETANIRVCGGWRCGASMRILKRLAVEATADNVAIDSIDLEAGKSMRGRGTVQECATDWSRSVGRLSILRRIRAVGAQRSDRLPKEQRGIK